MTDELEKRVPLRIPESLHKPARLKIAELGTSWQAVLTDLLEGWVSGNQPVVRPTQSPVGGRHARWHTILDAILDSGDRDQIQFVQQHLLMYERTANQQAANSAAKTKKVG